VSLLSTVLIKLARTWTWFWSREDLGSLKSMTPADAGYGTDTLRHLIFSRENLDNGGTEPVRPGRSLMRYILSSEDLPEAEPEPEPEPDEFPYGPHGGSLFRHIFRGESLPDASPPAPGPVPSFLGWFFSREHLPRAGDTAPEPDIQSNLEP
jgi:hypothetical protein